MPAGDLLFTITAENLASHWMAQADKYDADAASCRKEFEHWHGKTFADDASAEDRCTYHRYMTSAENDRKASERKAALLRFKAEHLAMPGPWCLTIEQCREEGLI